MMCVPVHFFPLHTSFRSLNKNALVRTVMSAMWCAVSDALGADFDAARPLSPLQHCDRKSPLLTSRQAPSSNDATQASSRARRPLVGGLSVAEGGCVEGSGWGNNRRGNVTHWVGESSPGLKS